MNDFTLEELEILLNAMNWWIMNNDEVFLHEVLLSKKISAIIDNYDKPKSLAELHKDE